MRRSLEMLKIYFQPCAKRYRDMLGIKQIQAKSCTDVPSCFATDIEVANEFEIQLHFMLNDARTTNESFIQTQYQL